MSGHIGSVGGPITGISDYEHTWEQDGYELNAYINLDEKIMDLGGNSIARHGRAAEQQLSEKEVPDVETGGNISIQTKQEPEWVWTDFWIVKQDNPGNFVVVKNSDGLFALELLSNSIGTNIEKVRFNLEEILSDFPGQWVGGFEERPGRVQSGLLYGDDIEDDIEMGDPFKRTSNKSVIGPKIEYRGQELKVKVGVDGYVQIVSPGTYSRDSYLSFLRDVMLNYTN